MAILFIEAQPRLSSRAAPALPPPELWTGWTYEGTYSLSFDEPVALVDQPVTIRVENLEPKQPLYGTYQGIDAMGLFWSILPVGAADPESLFLSINPEGLTLTLTAEAGSKTLTTTTLKRLLTTELIEQEVLDDGLAGKLFYPPAGGRYPALIVLGGTEGGIPVGSARLLASHGYAALALAYFRYDSLPPNLEEIPLEYFGKAIAWLKKRPVVEPDRIAVYGGSRRSEAALLVGATYPNDIRAVIALQPSAVAWQADSVGGFRQGKPAWTFEGKPIPSLKQILTPEIIGTILQIGGPYPNLTTYDPALDDPSAVSAAMIPVENIGGPILLISGADDQFWPSSRMAEMIMTRLKANNHPFEDQNLSYEGAGHWIGNPYLPAVSSIRSNLHIAGGSLEANAVASIDSRSKMLAFLDAQLRDCLNIRNN